MDATEAAAIRADVVALREDLQHLTRRLLARQDRDDLAAMLPAVHSLLGVATWTVQALNACASPASPLRDLLKDYASEPGGLRAFGHFLARTEGIACHGHRLPVRILRSQP